MAILVRMRVPDTGEHGPPGEGSAVGAAEQGLGGVNGDDPDTGRPVVASDGPAHATERELRVRRARAGRSLTAAEARLRRWAAARRLLAAVVLVGWVWLLAGALSVVPTPSGPVVIAMIPGTAALALAGYWMTRQEERGEAAGADARRVLQQVEREYDEAFQRMLDDEGR